MNIYVGNLSYRVRKQISRQVIEEYGAVDSVKLIVDRDTKSQKALHSLKCQTALKLVRLSKNLTELNTKVVR